MDILVFNKLTKPIYEGGATIDLSPKGMWQVSVRRPDGTYRYPFGEHWLPNLFINRFANGLLGSSTASSGPFCNWSTNGSFFNNVQTNTWSFINGYFFGSGSNTRKLAVGSSNAAVTASQTALQAEVRADSTPSSGNTADINFTTGGITYVISETFPVETGTVSYNEAGIKHSPTTASVAAINGINPSTSGILNRIVFPGAVTLNAGEALALKIAITIQSAAGTNGIPIDIAGQNGVNISGDLKLIGTSASILGGTVTSNGVPTINRDYPLLFNTDLAPYGILSTLTAFSTQDTNPTWGNTNPASGAWGSYTTDTRYRDATFTWGTNVPASNTNFRSICFRSLGFDNASGNPGSGTALGGYQLLLDNQMTKETTATLALSLRFTV
jgi:hypothetical protein